VQSGKDQVTGFRSQQRGGNRFEVAHFADEDDVRVLPKPGAQSRREIRCVDFDFALVDEAFLVAMQELDRVLNRDDVVGSRRVDAVDHRRKGSGLAGAGGSRDQYQPALLLANGFHGARQVQLFDGANLGGNDAQHHAHVPALLEHVDAETAQAGDAVGHVKFRGLLELLLLAVRHHAERHGKHFFRSDARHIREGSERAVDAQIGVVPYLQMKVRRLGFDGAA